MTLKPSISKRLSKLAPIIEDSHLYCLDLENISNAEYIEYYAILNKLEQQRAEEYANYKLASEFILCRAICKQLLASLLQLDVQLINFQYNAKGKPYLENYPLHFNISHSKKYALIAIAKQNIGIDVEYIDKNIEIEELMKIFAYHHERQWVLTEDSITRFYTLWTLKEAILKYNGDGITNDKFPYLINLEIAGYKLYKSILYNEYAFAICISS